ncbi:hypothetical protein JAO73_18400 [Hymenobacter sp. BT523]|uniref:hypothetical protein n=1 Tax=Hymenobacter sp. BT523 TaxID=2795725 RepID=UPI0018EC9CE3|nr:hypothetical protein [Hymenobacter sp. BT523]MBJ6111000.1 hypothetical protein [Hymenobacter sp. BT523]
MMFSFSIRLALAGLTIASALTACEQVTTCPLAIPAPAVLPLALSTDTLPAPGVGFRKAEWRTAYLVRYATNDFQRPIDTLRQPAATKGNRPVLFVYANGQDPPQFGVPQSGPDAQSESYRLVIPAANRQYDINNIVLTTEPGRSQCDGYRITSRHVTVNGQVRDALASPPLLTK